MTNTGEKPDSAAAGTLPITRVSPELEDAPPAAPAAVVIKIGGRALEAPGASAALAAEVGALAHAPVLVHGGGAEVSQWCERLGLKPRFVDGLRVTDAPTLEVAVAVLAGLANKRLVAQLRAAGADAVGLAALDGGIVAASRHRHADRLGAVGAVRAVDTSLLEELLLWGRTPVIASIGEREGELLNLNADDLAAALAGALGASTLVLLSDAPGLILGGAIVPRLDAAALEAACDHPEVKDGMRPKLRAALHAIAAGVKRVHIAAWSGPGTLAALLGGRGTGTTISATAAAALDGRGVGSSAVPAAAVSHD